MARQPTQDLQGLDNVAAPSANMVDAYAGAPAMPRQSSAGELADALGTLSRAGQKSAAKAKAEQEELDKKRAESYAARFKGEEGEFLDSVKLGETYAHLSDTVVATIVEDKHRLDFYSKTKASLNNLDNDIRYDVVALEKHFDALLADATEKTAGMDFVQSGAVQGVQSAIREMRGQFSAQQNAFTKEQSKSNTEAAIYNILDKYDVSTPDGQVSAIALMNDLNEHTLATSPYKKGEDKQIMVDALIAYNKSNPESGAVNLIQRMPFLQGGQTKQKLNDAGPQIAKLSMAATQRRLFQEGVKRDELLAEAQGKLNQLAEENDIEKIQQVQAEYAGAGDTPAERATANAIYEMAEIAEKSAQVDPDVSSTNYTLAKEDLTVRASLGTAGSSKEEIAAINARTDISPQQKSALIQEVPTLIQGNKIIASEQHSNTFRQRFGAVVDTYKNNPMLAAKSFELAQRGLSAETIAKDTWDSETGRLINLHIENNKEIPGYNDLYGDGGIYDKAGERVTSKLQEVASLQAQFIQLDSQQQEQPQETSTSTPVESSGVTFVNNGITYKLREGVDALTATDADWEVVGEAEVIEEPRDVEGEKRLADLVTTVFRAENDPTITNNKGSRKYAQAINELKKIPKEDLDAFVQPLADKAVQDFRDSLERGGLYFKYPWTNKEELEGLIEDIQENPANIFSDNRYTEMFLEENLK